MASHTGEPQPKERRYVSKAAAVSANEELERLRAENAALKEQSARAFKIKIGAKGGVSVYGMGRFPTTLYAEQWEMLLSHADEIKKYLKDHASELKRK